MGKPEIMSYAWGIPLPFDKQLLIKINCYTGKILQLRALPNYEADNIGRFYIFTLTQSITCLC